MKPSDTVISLQHCLRPGVARMFFSQYLSSNKMDSARTSLLGVFHVQEFLRSPSDKRALLLYNSHIKGEVVSKGKTRTIKVDLPEELLYKTDSALVDFIQLSDGTTVPDSLAEILKEVIAALTAQLAPAYESFAASRQYGLLKRQAALNKGNSARQALKERRQSMLEEAEIANNSPLADGFHVRPGKLHMIDIIDDPVGNAFFYHHCEREYSTENLEFYLGAAFLIGNKILKCARELLREHILAGADSQINIATESRIAIENAMNAFIEANGGEEADDSLEVNEEILEAFENSRVEVEELMYKDSFHRFLQSEDYEVCIEELDISAKSQA